MVYKVEILEDNKVKIIVKFTKEEFDKAISKNADKQGQEQLNSAVNQLISITYPEIVKKDNLEVAGYPSIALSNQIDDKYPFAYEAVVEVLPKLALGKYTGFNVKVSTVSVSEEEVEMEIKNSLNSHLTSKSVSGPLKEGHIAVIDFVGKKDGVAFDGGTASGYELEIGSHMFVPGFEEQMVGMQINEVKDLNITFPENYAADLAGKDVVFTVTLHEIKEKVLPELTDEFVKSLNIANVNSKKEYQEYTYNKILATKTARAKDEAVQEVFRLLKQSNPVKVPQFHIDEYVNNQLERVKAQAEHFQMPVEVLLQYTGFESVDAFKKAYAEVAQNHLHEQLILKEVIMKENLQATALEVEQAYETYAKQNNMDVKEFKERYTDEQILESILMEKGAKFIIENNIVE